MGDRNILLVDDEKHVLNSLKRLLRREGYTIFTAMSGAEGLTVMQEQDIDLVLSDQRMPVMSGVEFLQKVKELSPYTVRVVLSGYADVSVIVDSINRGEIYRFLGKPWNDDELKAIIRQCLERYDLLQENRNFAEQTRTQNERLEEMVEARTRSLQFAQEILEKLPFPIAGVSYEGEIIIVNDAARDTVPGMQHIVPGTALRDIFPENVAAAIYGSMKSGAMLEPDCFVLGDKLVKIQIRVLGSHGAPRGCILMLEAP